MTLVDTSFWCNDSSNTLSPFMVIIIIKILNQRGKERGGHMALEINMPQFTSSEEKATGRRGSLLVGLEIYRQGPEAAHSTIQSLAQAGRGSLVRNACPWEGGGCQSETLSQTATKVTGCVVTVSHLGDKAGLTCAVVAHCCA